MKSAGVFAAAPPATAPQTDWWFGMIDEDRWRKRYAAIRMTYESPGGGQWWAAYPKEPFSPEFAALVEEILGEQPDRGE